MSNTHDDRPKQHGTWSFVTGRSVPSHTYSHRYMVRDHRKPVIQFKLAY